MKPAKLHYSGVGLDRAASLRKNPRWIDQQTMHPDSLFIPVWQSKNLISGINNKSLPGIVHFSNEKYSIIQEFVSELVFLGLDSGKAVFACDISEIDENDLKKFFKDGDFSDLRSVGQSMRADEVPLLAYARGIMHWHKNHLFCSKCGSKSISQNGGHMRLCSNAGCKKETFPRTDPAVIMLVEHVSRTGVNRCLLGRNIKSPIGAFSTLAGFVDPGESLEEAVVREVFEEAGVDVRAVSYQGSQPWPFPSSIMLGFSAEAITDAINVDTDELAEARWFTAKELRRAGEWEDKNAGLKIPRKDSIARYLINSWINKQS